MHFGQVECKTSRVHASRELELVFGMEREEQDGTGEFRVTSNVAGSWAGGRNGGRRGEFQGSTPRKAHPWGAG